MTDRTEQLFRLIEEAGIGAALIVNPENVRYLSGFTGEGALLIADGLRAVITDSRYSEQAERQCPGFDVRAISLSTSPPQLVCSLLSGRGIDAVGFEPHHMTVAAFEDAKAELSGIQLRPLNWEVERLRRVKDAGEIDRIGKAAAIACKAFDEILGFIAPGKTEREIQRQLDFTMLGLGSEIVAFDTIACAGPNGSLPHATPSDRPVRHGELLTLDFGAQVDGYKCDMTRTVAVGGVSDELRAVYDTVYQAQSEAFKAIRPGASCPEIDGIARAIIDAKYPGRFGHSLGHGVGLNIHEAPNFSMRSKDTLEVGHVLTVEPGIYIPGLGGVRIEDMAIITPSGYFNPITAKRELIII